MRVYPLPCQGVTKQGYTKHYFEGTNRVCSKIGGGFHYVHWGNIEDRVPTLVEDYDQLSDGQRESVEHTFNGCLSIEIDMGSTIDLYEVVVHETERDDPEPAYFYHSDHLGSAAYLTHRGSVIQTLNYLPYGEDWLEYNFFHPADTTRLGIYRFNGKEKDYESGFHYYGARYYWSEVLTGWLSVDPMTDEFPSISGYVYCNNNPVLLIDEDGNFPFISMLVGMAGGFIKETVSQTISIGIENLNNGNGFFSGWGSKMDWADVGVATVTGGCVGLGLPVLASDLINVADSSLVDFTGGELNVASFGKEWSAVGKDALVNGINFGISRAMRIQGITNFDELGENVMGNAIAGYVTGLYGYGIKSGVDALFPSKDPLQKINLPEVTIRCPQDYNFINGKCKINENGETKLQDAVREAIDNL